MSGFASSDFQLPPIFQQPSVDASKDGISSRATTILQDRSNATTCLGVGLRFLVRPSCLLVLGWLLGRLDGSGRNGAWFLEHWFGSGTRVIMGSKTGKPFMDLPSTSFHPKRA